MQTRIIAAAIIVAVAALVLFTPWYPSVGTQVVTQTFTFAYSYPTTTSNDQVQTVYNLTSAIMLQGLFQSGATFSNVYNDIKDVGLVAGATVTVTVQQCQNCATALDKDFAEKSTVFSLYGSGVGDFVVPETGQYKLYVSNLGTTQDQVTSINISEDIPQSIVGSQTEYETHTVNVTEYSVRSVGPYLIMGILSAALIVAILALPLVALIAIEFGLIQVSVANRRRKRS